MAAEKGLKEDSGEMAVKLSALILSKSLFQIRARLSEAAAPKRFFVPGKASSIMPELMTDQFPGLLLSSR